MIKIEIKEGESIDRALKRYRRKFRDTQILKNLRSNKEFKKPSVVKREEKNKAIYKEGKFNNLD